MKASSERENLRLPFADLRDAGFFFGVVGAERRNSYEGQYEILSTVNPRREKNRKQRLPLSARRGKEPRRKK